MKKYYGEYVSPAVAKLNILVEQGFASSILDAGSEDYGEIISLDLENDLLTL